MKIVKEVTEDEQKTTLFEDEKKDEFATGYNDKAAGLNQHSTSRRASKMKVDGLDTGGLRPSSALLREFGLPVPHEEGKIKQDTHGSTIGMIHDPSSPLYDRKRRTSLLSGDATDFDFSIVKKNIDRAASSNVDKVSMRGEVITDRFGKKKFREIDESGRLIPNEFLDVPPAKGESNQLFQTNF